MVLVCTSTVLDAQMRLADASDRAAFRSWFVLLADALSSGCLLAALFEGGVRAVAPAAWIRRAWHWRTLALATLVFFVLLAEPWRLTMWRPDLSPTWMEPVIAGLRLATVALLGLIGSALLLSLAVRKSD